MKIYMQVEADHRDDMIPAITAMAVLGDNIERALTTPTSPFSAMMERARAEFIAAQTALLHVDLHTKEGMEQARSLQADARRYRDLCAWIVDAFDNREAAEEALVSEEDEDAVEELKDTLYGTARAKPAPDT